MARWTRLAYDMETGARPTPRRSDRAIRPGRHDGFIYE
jgi:hypothetical protein